MLWQVLLFAAGLLVLSTISIGSIYLVNKAREDNNWVLHTLEVENQISTLLLEVRRAESTAHGYLLTSEPEFRSRHQAAVGAIMPALDGLASQTTDNPVQVEGVKKLRAAIEQRLDQFAQQMASVERGDRDKAIALVRESASGSTNNEIRQTADRLLSEERRLFEQRTTNADRSQTLAVTMTAAGSGLVVLLACISIWLVQGSARARDEAEAALRDTNINLEGIVEERTADLREANNEIQRFAYIVSHDLRAPLVNIMGFTSELEELGKDIFRRLATLTQGTGQATAPPGSATHDPDLALEPADKQLLEHFSEALGFIKSSIGKMDRLITAILNLTREGRREFEPVRINMREMAESIVATLAHQAIEANAEIAIEPLPDIVSDRLAIERIFSNLLDNAIKYLKPGVPGKIVVRGRSKLGYAIFEVSDNGRGIDPKDHQRIFDLFRRAGAQDRPGQGIGLAHVRALVRRLGGTMSVISELGAGSTFTITLPAKWNTTNRNQDS